MNNYKNAPAGANGRGAMCSRRIPGTDSNGDMPRSPAELVIARVEVVMAESARRVGSGWRTRCPSCGSRTALSVSESESGAALVFCFAGCDTRDVLDALSLKPADLFRRISQQPVSRSRRDRVVELRRIAELRDRQEEARRRAATLWARSRAAHPQHRYLLEKQVAPHGIRQLGRLLVVPMLDFHDRMWNIQAIDPDGQKNFLKGGAKRNLHFTIGDIACCDYALICEGFATGAAIFEMTERPVVVAFDAGNMPGVAREIRTTHPNARIIVCADNDRETERRTGRNPGRLAAARAAEVSGGQMVIPPRFQKDFDDAVIAGYGDEARALLLAAVR